MTTREFLFEIGCEELPPKSLLTLSQSLSTLFSDGLKKENLSFKKIECFSTPRRLGILVTDLIEEKAPQKFERLGPAAKIAFDSAGKPSAACLGFAKSCHTTPEQLKIKKTAKGEFLYYETETPPQPTIAILPQVIKSAIKKLPAKRMMRWGTHDFLFVRPIHWTIGLFGHEQLKGSVFGKSFSNETRGHRFHHPEKISLTAAKDYKTALLDRGMVIADFNERKNKIKNQILKSTTTIGTPIIEDDLLSEVTAITEWPVILVGQFNSDFLQLPSPVLMTSMKIHQRCFVIKAMHQDEKNSQPKLAPYFVIVSNIESKKPELVIKGNERVINARLSDAAFFYQQDLNTRLQDRLAQLEHLVFQEGLGSMADKSQRIASLADTVAQSLTDINPAEVKQAGLLSKSDLLSNMVKEFPDLQGIMGYFYAKNDKLPDTIANAISEHYYPRFSGDRLPKTNFDACVALADRLDTLIGIIGLHKIPTGEKDPFGLRRAALGLLRILIEKKIPLDLKLLLTWAKNNYLITLPNNQAVDQAFQFIMERLQAWYLEQGTSLTVYNAVVAGNAGLPPTQPLDFELRIAAVNTFLTLPEAKTLVAAHKRVSQILKKEIKDNNLPKPNPHYFEHDAEKNLAQAIEKQSSTIKIYLEKNNYLMALREMALLKTPIDNFFDQVMVLVEDKKIRHNRLALLQSLENTLSCLINVSLLS